VEGKLNQYNCYWKDQVVCVDSDTSFHAQLLAVEKFRKVAGRRRVAPSDVTVFLTYKDDKEIIHDPSVIG
jgi:hypothetical protein